MNNIKHLYTNELINETSPYLLQHAHNPVNWHSWNADILEFAQKNDKLLLISIGYSACHWCHVMENESFMDEEVATVMNQYFVCIKVDREEHPDVDHLYMNAVQIINGNGGWPLNCFALSDGSAFWGGTYFAKEQWKEILQQIILLKEKTPYKLYEQADLLKKQILKNSELLISGQPILYDFDFEKQFQKVAYQFDNLKGGGIGAPKFPIPVLYDYLLTHYYFYKNNEAIKHINLSLNEMAKGGIFDHLAGGFARYATDRNWRIPHFEKMLYDNAQLISLYANAYRLTKNVFYRNVCQQVLNFSENYLMDECGLYYSAIDADSEGVEGKYYCWTKKEIDEILAENSEVFCMYFNVSEKANWENGQNILYVSDNEDEILERFQLSPKQLYEILEHSKSVLLTYRNKRIAPLCDNKMIVSWNALMIIALLDAFFAFGDKKLYQRAKQNTEFIIDNYFQKSNKLLRIKNKNGNHINGLLDDYSFLIGSLISLYKADGDEKWIIKAKELIDFCLLHFYDKKSGLFYYNADFDNKLYIRNKELTDHVIPSSNSVLFKNLYLSGVIFSENKYILLSEKASGQIQSQIETHPILYSNWLNLQFIQKKKFLTVCIVGKKAEEYAREINSFYMPDVFVLQLIGKSKIPLLKDKAEKSKTLIYICSGSECLNVIDNLKDALEALKKS